MSRMTIALPLMLFGPAAAGAAPQVSAERAMSNYRATFKSPGELDCPRDGDAIVVCGRRSGERDPNRVPLATTPEPGSRVRGEALEGGLGCLNSCHQPVQVNILAIPRFIAKVVERLKDD